MNKQEQTQKRPYSAPELRVYGDVTKLTQSAGKLGISDNGSGVNKRTH